MSTQTTVPYGVHDREGAHLVPAGGWCVDTVALSERPAPTDYPGIKGDINWIARLNWGYGSTGTIPIPDYYPRFAELCAHYVQHSKGLGYVIIGNEPNHENERPDGRYISPLDYADCFNRCYDAIKAVAPHVQVLVAAPAPYHANPLDWTEWYRVTLLGIKACDGFSIHAYARGAYPDAITSDAKMGEPLAHTYASFRTYRDQIAIARMVKGRGLPFYITEYNPLPPDVWSRGNTGQVQAAYAELMQYVHANPDVDIRCLCLFRYLAHDKEGWGIADKPGIVADFMEAVGRGYTLRLPQVSKPAAPAQPAPPPAPVPSGAIDPTVAKAILAIESGGQGYGPDGRVLIRFEPHIFMGFVDRDTFNRHFQVGRPIWDGAQHGYRAYPTAAFDSFHGNQAKEYSALAVAKELNVEGAYRSISMGAAQIMGFNAPRCGYASARLMYNDFADPNMQTLAFLNFVLTDPTLFAAVRNKDWRTIARLYNGPANVNTYAPLLENTYRKLGGR